MNLRMFNNNRLLQRNVYIAAEGMKQAIPNPPKLCRVYTATIPHVGVRKTTKTKDYYVIRG